MFFLAMEVRKPETRAWKVSYCEEITWHTLVYQKETSWECKEMLPYSFPCVSFTRNAGLNSHA